MMRRDVLAAAGLATVPLSLSAGPPDAADAAGCGRRLIARDDFRHGLGKWSVDLDYSDPEPYSRGWFAFRTTWSHLLISDFSVWRRYGR